MAIIPGSLKVDIINNAYSELRISGLTVNPSASNYVTALRKLEAMAHEFEKRGIVVGYNFEDTPDINSSHGIEPCYWYAFECILASRLLSDFGKGKEPDTILLKNASGQMSFLYSSTARPIQAQYPGRQSIGAGNTLRFGIHRRFYAPVAQAPVNANQMDVGDVNNFIEHFDAYLIDPEVISSFTIAVDDGLTLNSSSNTDTDVLYNITADGDYDGFLQVKIVVTTDAGRKETRLIDFESTRIRAIP